MHTKREWIAVRDASNKPGRIAKVTTLERQETLDGDDWLPLRDEYFTEAGEPLCFDESDGSFTDTRSGKRFWPV